MLGDREHVELPVKDEIHRARRGLISRNAVTGEPFVLDFPGRRAVEGISPSVPHIPQYKTRTRVGFRRIRQRRARGQFVLPLPLLQLP